MKTGFQMYEDEFLERGRAEGKSELTRSVIQSALSLNLPVEQIAQICSCGVERVKQVQKSMENENWRTITESKKKEAVQTDSVWLLFTLHGNNGK